MEETTLRPLPPNPCSSHPCGSNALCNIVNGQAECACLANMIGSAPNCRPECIISSDCPSNSACINQKCVDPCPGSCTTNADCRVVNHSPVCSCVQGFQGDGFRDCSPTPVVGKYFLRFKLETMAMGNATKRRACLLYFSASAHFYDAIQLSIEDKTSVEGSKISI